MKALRDKRSHQAFYQDEHLFVGLRHQLAILVEGRIFRPGSCGGSSLVPPTACRPGNLPDTFENTDAE